MSFIGIIGENHAKQQIDSEFKKENIIHINEKNIDNMKNIKFETILVLGKIATNKEIVKKIITKAKYLIINSDREENLELINEIDVNVITYGFNSKSTITASSVNEDEMLICVQRRLEDRENNEIEPQEIKIERKNLEITNSSVIGIVSLFLLYGKTLTKL